MSARRCRGIPLALGMLIALSPALLAQSRTAGRVARVVDGDTLPVGPSLVVLHRVGRDRQGPVDSLRTEAGGRFRFRFGADSTATFLLSVRYQGIEYFSAPISAAAERPDTAVLILVADTSSTAPVRTRERTLLISRADQSGTRAVVDWFVLQNAGERTRVAGDSLHPSWSAALPPEAQAVELADIRLSQFSPDALEFRNDSALIFAPLSPGQKELVLQYRIPGAARRFVAPAAAGTESVFVLLEESSARVTAPALALTDSQQIEGRTFRRWRGAPEPAQAIVVAFPPPPLSPATLLTLLVALTAFGFLGLAVFRLRRRPAAATVPHPLYLADAVARLDADWLERGGLASPEEAAAYRAERARLRADLDAALAASRRRS